MPKRGKKYSDSRSKIDTQKRHEFAEAVESVINSAFAKFDETIDMAVRLGVDPRHADQMVRGTVILPNGLGKEVKVLVFAKGEKEAEAKEAGADFVGSDDLIEKIKGSPVSEKVVGYAQLVGLVMIEGWPIAHHVFRGNWRDASTVPAVIKDLQRRFGLARVIFVGDRGMMTSHNLEQLRGQGQGYVVGLNRRRRQDVLRYLEQATGPWLECPVGVAAREKLGFEFWEEKGSFGF